MATVVLNRTGQKMPIVGFGLYEVTDAENTVYEAIKAGVRLFDGAAHYGNEKEAGKGVRRAIDEGLVERKDLFITSKLWSTFHAKEHVKPITQMQLEHWGIDYFDLFLIHFPIALRYVDPTHRYPPEFYGDDDEIHLQNTPMQETWTALEELVDDGLARNIGLSNCNGSLILDVLRYARIEPQVLQVEHHPYLTQEALVNMANKLGIAVTAYSPFCPRSSIVDGGEVSLMKHNTITTIASKHKRTPAQVLLRWSTQRGIAVIPRTNTISRIGENLQCDSFILEESDIRNISSLNRSLRSSDPGAGGPRLAIFV